MKSYLFLPMLILLAGACHGDTMVEPSAWLYQRWHLVQSRKVQDKAWTINADVSADTEFRPDGTLIYRRSGSVIETPCCASNRFEYANKTVRFIGSQACPFALCTSSPNANVSVVTSLSQPSLELMAGDWMMQYVSVH